LSEHRHRHLSTQWNPQQAFQQPTKHCSRFSFSDEGLDCGLCWTVSAMGTGLCDPGTLTADAGTMTTAVQTSVTAARTSFMWPLPFLQRPPITDDWEAASSA
jgi:hypothetical protein